MRRAAAAVLLAGSVLCPSPALAHDRADVRILLPAEGSAVIGDRVTVVMSAGAGQGPAEFALRLDGQPVDTRGVVGSGAVFTTIRLRPGQSGTLVVALAAPGTHVLRLEPLPHGDDPQPVQERRFTSVLPSEGPSASPSPSTAPDDSAGGAGRGDGRVVLLAALGGALLAGVVFALRRRGA